MSWHHVTPHGRYIVQRVLSYYICRLYTYIHGLILDPEDGGKKFVWNIGELPDYTASHPTSLLSSHSLAFSFLGLRIMVKPSYSRSSHRTLFLYILVIILCSVSLLCLFHLHGKISGIVSLGTLLVISEFHLFLVFPTLRLKELISSVWSLRLFPSIRARVWAVVLLVTV